jgi:hypothetical protein
VRRLVLKIEFGAYGAGSPTRGKRMQKFKITHKFYDVELSLKEMNVEGVGFNLTDGQLIVEKVKGKPVVVFAAGEWVSIEAI